MKKRPSDASSSFDLFCRLNTRVWLSGFQVYFVTKKRLSIFIWRILHPNPGRLAPRRAREAPSGTTKTQTPALARPHRRSDIESRQVRDIFGLVGLEATVRRAEAPVDENEQNRPKSGKSKLLAT
jgi:hypothetical protein